MLPAFEHPTPLGYFATLVREDQGFALLEATAAVALDEYPELDLQQLLGQVDQMARRLQRRLPADAGPLERLRRLNQFFFGDLAFSGNVNHYHDPDNSYLNRVLERRRGIPITLGVLWLELAQGLGLPARGINFPGHFLVKVGLEQGQVVIDPFTGQSLSREDLSERLEPFRRRHGLVDEFEPPVELYLQSAPERQILARVLRNLKEIQRQASDWPRLLQVLERLVILLPEDWSERRDRGLALANLGCIDEAIADLKIYLVQAEDAPDHDLIAHRMAQLRGASR